MKTNVKLTDRVARLNDYTAKGCLRGCNHIPYTNRRSKGVVLVGCADQQDTVYNAHA